MEKITAEELRIGNFVYAGKMTEYIEVFGINHTIEDGWLINQQIPISHIKPIPLTEEWLIKFGFSREVSLIRNKFYLHLWDDVYLRLEWHKADKDNKVFGIEDVNDDDSFSNFWQQIKYVHQLQSLYFALTGTELTIK